MIYFDSTFLVKLQVREQDSSKIMRFVQEKNEVLATSILARIEVSAALHRQHREKLMTREGIVKAHEQFLREIEVGRVVTLAFTSSIVAGVEEAFRKLPPTTFLRAGDAIHLVTAQENGYDGIYSNDRHLLAAAPLFKLKGINPLENGN